MELSINNSNISVEHREYYDEKQLRDYYLAERSTFLRINLDAIFNNIKILKQHCADHTDIIAVIKDNAYGHGAIGVAHHLWFQGIRHFAVATVVEGVELRRAGIDGFIQVLGNACLENIPRLQEYQLTPTVATQEFISAWIRRWVDPKDTDNKTTDPPKIVLMLDTGMSRNGCQPEDLDALVKLCRHDRIQIHSIMTHFAQSWDDPDFTQRQLDKFTEAVFHYRSKGVKLHAANSAGILRGYGTDLDFVRPGIAMYGQPPDANEKTAKFMTDLGFRPALSWIAKPSLVKYQKSGSTVGYGRTYRSSEGEIIATFSLGYGDGYNRSLSNVGFIQTDTGEDCLVVGDVSMDAITVRLSKPAMRCQNFCILTDDYTSTNSILQTARNLKIIPSEVMTGLAARLPRLYMTQDRTVATQNSLGQLVVLGS